MESGYWTQHRTPYVQADKGDDPEEVIAVAQCNGAVITYGDEDYLVLSLPQPTGTPPHPSLYTEEVARIILPQALLT